MTHYVDSFPGREITIDDRKYRYFGGTSYLGIQTDIDFQEIYIRNVKRYGTNYGASRNSNIRFSIYKEAENQLTRLVGSESCVTLSSGYLAGQLVCNYFGGKQYKLFYAPNTHSALYQSKIRPYTTFTALNIALREYLSSPESSTPIVCMDSIDFSGNNYPNFEGLKSLPLEAIILVVDDSHGIGVVGANGEGVYNMLKSLNPKELIVCCSLGKSFGIQTGAVFGNKERISAFMATDFFGGASPTAPANLATFIEAQEIYKLKRKSLIRNIQLFKSTLNCKTLFSGMENHPAFSYSCEDLTKHLFKNQLIVTSFGYPTDEDTTMSRIVLSAAHTKGDIQYLVKILNSY